MRGALQNGLLTVGGALALFLPAAAMQAQGPPVNTETAFVNGLEGAAFRSFVFSVRRSGLASDDREIADPFDREVSIYGVPIVFPYEVLKNRLVVAAGLPVLRKEMQITENGRRRTLSTSGFGDAFIASKLLLVRHDREGRTTRFAATGQLKLPTGADDDTDDQGNPLPPALQLGSGSVDYALGGVFTHVRRRIGFNADASLRRRVPKGVERTRRHETREACRCGNEPTGRSVRGRLRF